MIWKLQTADNFKVPSSLVRCQNFDGNTEESAGVASESDEDLDRISAVIIMGYRTLSRY
jgi:hypothetical protein